MKGLDSRSGRVSLRAKMDRMPVTLIVAAQTVGSPELAAEVDARVEARDRTFHLLVPMQPPPTALAVGLAAAESAASLLIDLPDPHEVAAERLEVGLAWLRNLGATATGEVGSSDIVSAVKVIVEREHADEVIVSTLPHRVSRWLKQDLPNRVQRAVAVPVVVATAGRDGPT